MPMATIFRKIRRKVEDPLDGYKYRIEYVIEDNREWSDHVKARTIGRKPKNNSDVKSKKKEYKQPQKDNINDEQHLLTL